MSFREWAQRVRDPDPQPRYHGDDRDPRYPSPRELRKVFAYLADVALHLAVAFAVFLQLDDRGTLLAIGATVLAYLTASFTNRVVVQRILHGTIGKALFGLVLIRRDTGGRVRLGQLLGMFFVRGLVTIVAVIVLQDVPDAEDESDNTSVVRRRDVTALRRTGRTGQQPPAPPQPQYPPPNQHPPQHYSPQHRYLQQQYPPQHRYPPQQFPPRGR
ncbi:hypothetical protein ACFVMC_01190 [Nocardia sp. NPDC127579]|uniref:hypothetical protein n=1 Tax=Nocardia sp. NPDC127579 TaxID=3345402 RepID=UPI00362FECB6